MLIRLYNLVTIKNTVSLIRTNVKIKSFCVFVFIKESETQISSLKKNITLYFSIKVFKQHLFLRVALKMQES